MTKNWSQLLTVAKELEQQPIVFIAVNSGTTRADLARYVRINKISWPVIVDSDRSLESQCNAGVISLNNILQLRFLTPDGEMFVGDKQFIASGVDRAVKGASWSLDPADFPARLIPAVRAIEFGNFPAAAKALTSGVKSEDADVRKAAVTLNEIVQQEIESRVEAAKQAWRAGEKWNAYKIYSTLPKRFKGYELPPGMDTTLKKLAADPTVKSELAAMKSFATAKKLIATGREDRMRTASTRLKKIISESPDTEAAALAKDALDQLPVVNP